MVFGIGQEYPRDCKDSW